jgi:hypothetical protein
MEFLMADDAEMAARVAAEALEVFKPELGTSPRVYYKNMHRWTKVFVAGSAYFADSGDCAEGCEVTISKDGAVVGSATTNNFGDFLVDKLARAPNTRWPSRPPGTSRWSARPFRPPPASRCRPSPWKKLEDRRGTCPSLWRRWSAA